MSSNVRVKFIVAEDRGDQLKSTNTSNNVLINPVLVMRAPIVPTALSIALVVLTSGLSSNENHEMELSITNVNTGEQIYKTGINQFSIPNHTDNFSFNFDLKNLLFMNEGDYHIQMNIDGVTHEDVFTIVANKVLG